LKSGGHPDVGDIASEFGSGFDALDTAGDDLGPVDPLGEPVTAWFTPGQRPARLSVVWPSPLDPTPTALQAHLA
jgi:hypothetical protein